MPESSPPRSEYRTYDVNTALDLILPTSANRCLYLTLRHSAVSRMRIPIRNYEQVRHDLCPTLKHVNQQCNLSFEYKVSRNQSPQEPTRKKKSKLCP